MRPKAVIEDTASLLVLVAITTGLSLALHRKMLTLDPEAIEAVLTNLATVAGVVSALALTGFTAATLSSAKLKRLISTRARTIWAILVASFTLTCGAATACAVLVGFPASDAAVWAASVTPAVLLASLMGSGLVAFGLFSQGLDGRESD